MKQQIEKELSVIIATRNRAGILGDTLEVLSNQLTDRDEVIVVDNGSTDETAEAVDAFQQRIAGLKYLFEAQPGKSSARNKGIAEARGRWVAFLDDDAIPLPGWRQSAVSAFEELPEHWGALQGQIIPKVEGGKPPWMSDNDFSSLSSRVMKGDEPLKLTKEPWLVTANVLCKKEVLDEVGGFNRLFDQCGYGEDVELAIQIRRCGYDLFYYPNLKVHHVLPPSRFTLQSLVQRRYNGAVGECLVYYIIKEGFERVLFVGTQLVKRPVFLLAVYLGLLIGKLRGREQDIAYLRTRIARSLGYLKGVALLLKAGWPEPRPTSGAADKNRHRVVPDAKQRV